MNTYKKHNIYLTFKLSVHNKYKTNRNTISAKKLVETLTSP